MSTNYNKWALPCLFRELRRLYLGRMQTESAIVSEWMLKASNMHDRVPSMSFHPAYFWIRWYFLPDWELSGLPDHPIILELKRRIKEHEQQHQEVPNP